MGIEKRYLRSPRYQLLSKLLLHSRCSSKRCLAMDCFPSNPLAKLIFGCYARVPYCRYAAQFDTSEIDVSHSEFNLSQTFPVKLAKAIDSKTINSLTSFSCHRGTIFLDLTPSSLVVSRRELHEWLQILSVSISRHNSSYLAYAYSKIEFDLYRCKVYQRQEFTQSSAILNSFSWRGIWKHRFHFPCFS